MKGIRKKNRLRRSIGAAVIITAIATADVVYQMYLERRWIRFPLRGGKF